MRSNRQGHAMSGPKQYPYKYCGSCTQRLDGKPRKLKDHWELNHANPEHCRWLLLNEKVEHSVYSNFEEHSESPDTVTLKWRPEFQKLAWNRRKAHKPKIEQLEVQEDKIVIDDLFVKSAPLGKDSPAIFNQEGGRK